jgi:hypothetical protein
MKKLFILFMLVCALVQSTLSKDKYHILEFTASEPIIKERCVDYQTIKNKNQGYVKESLDSLNRCIKLEFFKKPNVYFSAIDLPSIIEYNWTDSSVIEILYRKNYKLLAMEGNMIRPNKIEYMMCNKNIKNIKEFFNDTFLKSKTIKSEFRLEDATFFLMYSGCEKKYNKKYRTRF